MLPRASQELSVTAQGLLVGGSKPHSMAAQLSSCSNQCPHALQASSTIALAVLLVLLHPWPSTNSHNTHAIHTHVHTTTTHTHTTCSHRPHTVTHITHNAPPCSITHNTLTHHIHTAYMHNTHTHSDRHITYTSHSPALRCMLTHSLLALWVVRLPLHLHSGPPSTPHSLSASLCSQQQSFLLCSSLSPTSREPTRWYV